MELEFVDAPRDAKLERIYIAMATMRNFRGHSHMQAHIFRHGATASELETLREMDLVAPAPAGIPPEILAGATEDAALRCLLESFTRAEAEELAAYLKQRYGEQFEKLVICPLELPVPLGVGPLADMPEGEKSGFIHFDKAPGYPLSFTMKAYYDLNGG